EPLRMPLISRPNRRFLNRVVDHASFAISASAGLRWASWSHVLLVESPPLFLGMTARWLAVTVRRPYVLHVADPWPDYPIEIGALRNSAAIAFARRLEAAAYSGAAAITTPTAGCASMIEKQSAARGRVTVIPNGVDTTRFLPEMSEAEARSRLGWTDSGVMFVYAGTVGLAQGVRTLLDATALLNSRGPFSESITIRILGAGAEREELKREAETRGLANVVFSDPLPSSMIPLALAASDAVAVVLRGGRLAEAAFPTKLTEGLAAGRALIVSADGESARVVEASKAGVVAPAEDAMALSHEMERLIRAPAERRRMGLNARAVAQPLDRAVTVRTIADVLQRAGGLNIAQAGS